MATLKYKEKKVFSIKLAKKIIFSLIIVLIFDFFLFPAPTLAAAPVESGEEVIIDGPVNIEPEVMDIVNNLPENSDLEVLHTSYHTITAYSSEVSQCDGNPCVTANGFNLCEHGIEDSIAANWLKFGTKVKIPELYGDRVFVVRDRMNSKYDNRVDIWMKEKADAKNFGIRVAKIEVLDH